MSGALASGAGGGDNGPLMYETGVPDRKHSGVT